MRQFNRYYASMLIFLISLGLLMGCSLSLNQDIVDGTAAGKDGDSITTSSQSTTGVSKPSTASTNSGQVSTTTVSKPAQTVPSSYEIDNRDYPSGAVVARRPLGTINTLDPHKISLSSEAELAGYLFGALYHLGGSPQTGEAMILPYHAAALPESFDQQNYTIRLKPGLTWSDGTPITAFSYLWSMEKLLDPEAQNPLAVEFTDQLPLNNAKSYQSGVIPSFAAVGIKALDEVTLELTLAMPLSAEEVALGLTEPLLIPLESLEQDVSEEAADFTANWRSLKYSGAYELEAFYPGRSVVLKRRQDPVLDELMKDYFTSDYISLSHFDSNFAALEAFQQDDLDIVPVAGTAYKKLTNDPRLHLAEANTVWGIYLNLEEPLLADSDFRQALYWGTDRTRIAVGIFGSYKSYSGFVGPQSLVEKNERKVAYRKTRESKSNAKQANVYDLNKAQEFANLAKARMDKTEVLELKVPADEQMLVMAEFLKNSWENLFEGSLEIQISPVDLTKAYESYRNGDYQLGFGAMGQDVFDPYHSMMAFRSDFPGKLDRMKSIVFDQLHNEATSGVARLDPARRLELLRDMEAYLLEELPQIPLFVSADAYLISEELELPFKEFIPGVGFGLDQAHRKMKNKAD